MTRKKSRTSQPETVAVQLAVDTTIQRVKHKMGATVTVPVARMEIMKLHGFIVQQEGEQNE